MSQAPCVARWSLGPSDVSLLYELKSLALAHSAPSDRLPLGAHEVLHSL
jgi:hypothetical protein